MKVPASIIDLSPLHTVQDCQSDKMKEEAKQRTRQKVIQYVKDRVGEEDCLQLFLAGMDVSMQE